MHMNPATMSGGHIPQNYELKRTISWTGAFWVASGVPALVLFSIGGIATELGTPSWLCWMVSSIFGLFQAFVYAEMAGLFPGKSGGVSVYGASAWYRYAKIIAPLSLWSNWLAWTPVLSIGASLAAGYILAALFLPDAWIRTAEIPIIDLGLLKEGLQIRIDAVSIIGTILLLITFAIQHRGILGTARVQMIIGICALTPLLLIGVVPFLTGDIVAANINPFAETFVPLSGAWDKSGWALLFGCMFIAAWSTYAFETSVCYTREFRDPATDTFKAIMWCGVVCLVTFTIVPMAFQGYLGVDGLKEEGIADGSAVAGVMARMVGGTEGGLIASIIVIMLILALFLSITTSMAGSSRTLYQGSVDGWLPRYLSKVNDHGAPTRAMWTDLGFNVILLLMSDIVFVLAISSFCYLVFTFLNLQAGWIHRIDNAHIKRPYRAPNIMLAIGAVLGFVNAFFLGAGANIWGAGVFVTGTVTLAIILPVFWYRHYVVDKGVFPPDMAKDLHVPGDGGGTLVRKKAGWLPFGALGLGIIIVILARLYFADA